MREDVGLQAAARGQTRSEPDNPPFDYLVERYYRPLYQFAFSLTRSEADAADLTQHTFLTWQTKGQQLRDLTKVRCWLFTTLHRAFLQAKRRETRFPHFQLEQVDSELPSISNGDINRLDAADALGALGRIDEVFRTPLTLFYLEDCPYKEIAQMLNVPLGTVKSRIARGIAQLKSLLTRSDRFQQAAA